MIGRQDKGAMSANDRSQTKLGEPASPEEEVVALELEQVVCKQAGREAGKESGGREHPSEGGMRKCPGRASGRTR